MKRPKSDYWETEDIKEFKRKTGILLYGLIAITAAHTMHIIYSFEINLWKIALLTMSIIYLTGMIILMMTKSRNELTPIKPEIKKLLEEDTNDRKEPTPNTE